MADHEQGSSRDLVFVRKARLAAEQALFYLYNAAEVLGSQGTPQERQHYVAFALDQAVALVNGVHISRDYLLGGKAHATAPAHVKLWRDAIWAPLNALRVAPDRGAVPAATIEDLGKEVDRFLHVTRPSGGWSRVRHVGRHVERAIRRRLTVIVGVVVFAALLLTIEPVGSLILNQGPWVLGPVVAALSPLLVRRLLARPLRLSWGLRAYCPTRVLEPERSLPRWPTTSPFTYYTLGAFARDFALWVVVLALAGLLVERLGAIDGGTSYLTIFLTFALIMLALRVCRFLDRWDFIDERAIRALSMLGGLLVAVLILGEWFRLLAAAVLVCGAYVAWLVRRHGAPNWLLAGIAIVTLYATVSSVRGGQLYEATTWRNPEAAPAPPVRITPADWPFPGDAGPVVLVAASGGGSRAAIYTAKTLARLHAELPSVAERINAISSVSGGSLASAAYIARRYRGAPLADLERAMQRDFLLPTLEGALLPLGSRGQALERDWEIEETARPSLGDLTIGKLTQRWSAAAAAAGARGDANALPPFPLPLFNTCTLDGHDVVISPLPRWVYTKAAPDTLEALRARYGLDAEDEPTWVVDRDGIYGLEDLLDRADPQLTRAVRASANFPFGFPLVRVATSDDRLVLSPLFRYFVPKVQKAQAAQAANVKRPDAPPAIVELTDGGVLSNSGLWSLYHLMTDQSPLVADAPTDTMVQRLRERGVLLIIVEASRMPQYEDSHRSLLTLAGTLGDKNPVAQSLHRRMFEVLHDRYSTEKGSRIAIVQLDLIPKQARESFNVHTTWALDPVSNDKLNRSFDSVWRWVQPIIAEKFEKLREHEDPGQDLVLRPPLD